jgi:hypothetical protein
MAEPEIAQFIQDGMENVDPNITAETNRKPLKRQLSDQIV